MGLGNGVVVSKPSVMVILSAFLLKPYSLLPIPYQALSRVKLLVITRMVFNGLPAVPECWVRISVLQNSASQSGVMPRMLEGLFSLKRVTFTGGRLLSTGTKNKPTAGSSPSILILLKRKKPRP